MGGGIVIMGAGVLGLSLGWELARRGAALRILEAERVGAGASGGLVGALAPHAPEGWTPGKEAQLESLLAAPAFWGEVQRAGGVDPGYAREGRYQPLLDEAAIARAEARGDGARTHWRGVAELRVLRAAEAPGLGLACDWVSHDTLSARIAPRRALAALQAALASRGIAVERGREPPSSAARMVWANGHAGLSELGLGGAQKGQAALLAADWRGSPQISAPGLHIVPHADGTTAIGSTSEGSFSDLGTDHRLDAVIAKAVSLCPALSGAEVIERWAGLRPRAASREPVLGALPERSGEYVLNGGFKIGFGIAPLAARLMADLLLEGEAAVPESWRL